METPIWGGKESKRGAQRRQEEDGRRKEGPDGSREAQIDEAFHLPPDVERIGDEGRCMDEIHVEGGDSKLLK